MSVRGIKHTRSMSNNRCNGLGLTLGAPPPRIGISPMIRSTPEFGLHCQKSTFGKCCCLPISQTWHMNCKEAKEWLVERGYIDANGNGPNQTCAGGVGNSNILSHYCSTGNVGHGGSGGSGGSSSDWVQTDFSPEWYIALFTDNSTLQVPPPIKIFTNIEADPDAPFNVIVHVHGGSYTDRGQYTQITTDTITQQGFNLTTQTAVVVITYPLIDPTSIANLLPLIEQGDSNAFLQFLDIAFLVGTKAAYVVGKIITLLNTGDVDGIKNVNNVNIIGYSAGAISTMITLACRTGETKEDFFALTVTNEPALITINLLSNTRTFIANHFQEFKCFNIANKYVMISGALPTVELVTWLKNETLFDITFIASTLDPTVPYLRGNPIFTLGGQEFRMPIIFNGTGIMDANINSQNNIQSIIDNLPAHVTQQQQLVGANIVSNFNNEASSDWILHNYLPSWYVNQFNNIGNTISQYVDSRISPIKIFINKNVDKTKPVDVILRLHGGSLIYRSEHDYLTVNNLNEQFPGITTQTVVVSMTHPLVNETTMSILMQSLQQAGLAAAAAGAAYQADPANQALAQAYNDANTAYIAVMNQVQDVFAVLSAKGGYIAGKLITELKANLVKCLGNVGSVNIFASTSGAALLLACLGAKNGIGIQDWNNLIVLSNPPQNIFFPDPATAPTILANTLVEFTKLMTEIYTEFANFAVPEQMVLVDPFIGFGNMDIWLENVDITGNITIIYSDPHSVIPPEEGIAKAVVMQPDVQTGMNYTILELPIVIDGQTRIAQFLDSNALGLNNVINIKLPDEMMMMEDMMMTGDMTMSPKMMQGITLLIASLG